MGPAADASSLALRTDTDYMGDKGSPRAASTISAEESAKSSLAEDGRACAIAPIVQLLASLLWLPQAGLLATGVGDIAAGRGVTDMYWLAAGVVAIGMVRAMLDAAGSRLAFRTARDVLSEKRKEAISALAARSPLDIDRPASGFAASVLAEQAEAILLISRVSVRRA